ncbi:hypothetical protein BRC97_12545 [Halobacteriales archaeon QS_6_71_20]|nr:MAG: hypothetical protein BRC97_12545 [Halobacteriales archaeon QS_6_71_20]
MDLDELRSVQSKERRKDSLQHLRGSFYEDVATFLLDRKRRRDERAAAVDDPFSDSEVRKLSDEIDTAEEVVESLYERRVGKVVKLASFAAAGAPTDTDGMTVQEAELFEDLVVRIEQNKGRVLDVLDGGADATPAGPAAETAATPDREAVTPEADVPSVAGDAAGAPDERDADGGPAAPPESPTAASESAGGGGVLADAMGGPGGADGDADATPADPAPDGGASTADAPTVDSSPPADPSPSPDSGGPGADPAPGPSPADEFASGSEPDRTGDAKSEGAGDDAVTPGRGAAAGHAGADDAGTPGSGDRSTGEGGESDRRTVRITRDVGRILGVDDIEYELATEDVVTLPSENAEPLVQRDAAEPVE